MNVTTSNISLPSELARYVRDKVNGGFYSSVSEVVSEALRCLSAPENGKQHGLTFFGGRFARAKAEEAIHAIRELQNKQTLGAGLSIEDLIKAGRDA
jgi:hypothetical protein